MATLTLPRQRREVWLRAGRDGFSVVGAVLLAVVLVSGSGGDAHAYWSFSAADPYSGPVGTPNGFLYSPVAALVLLPLHLLSFPAFRLVLLAAEFAALAWLARSWTLVALVFVPVAVELSTGNVQLLLALAIVAGFRWPAAWSFVLLTKVTPGVGLLWFAVRREWSSLGIALGATAALAAASALIVPGWWPGWIDTLVGSVGHAPPTPTLPLIALAARLPAAALLVAWGAHTDRQWTVPVAAMLALPVVWWTSLSMLVGVVPLLRRT